MTTTPRKVVVVQARRRTGLLAAMLVMMTAGLTAGCELSFNDEAPATQTVNLVRAGRLLTQAETKAAIPGAGSTAPSGYAAESKNLLKPVPTRGDTVRPARCGALYHGLDIDFVKSRAKSYSTFMNSDKTYLGVGVASKQRLAGVVARRNQIGSCQEFQVTSTEGPVRITTRPLPFPKMGEQSVALRFTMRAPGVTLHGDSVRIQVGHNMVSVDKLSTTPLPRNPVEIAEVANGVLLNLSN